MTQLKIKKTKIAQFSLWAFCLLTLNLPFTETLESAYAAPIRFKKPSSRSEASATRKFKDFKDLRADLLNMIGNATTRVWVSSNFLSDGDIVSALYIAQYRKIDVQVLLGRAKSRKYMSRLRFLKAQSIPVFLMPNNFPQYGQSALLIDEKLLSINGELNFMAKRRGFQISYGNSARSRSYMTAFAKAAKLKIPARMARRRVSIRSKGQRKRYKRSKAPSLNSWKTNPRRRRAIRKEDSKDTYYYRGSSPSKPTQISGKLPKKTKWQLRMEKQFEKEENSRKGYTGSSYITPSK